MRKLIYKVLLAGVILPFAIAVTNPEISVQPPKNLIQSQLGPISNSINISSQDGTGGGNSASNSVSSSLKPFSTMYTNSIYGQPMTSSVHIHMKQPSPLVTPSISLQSPGNYGTGVVTASHPSASQQIKHMTPPPVQSITVQPNFTPILNPVKQSNPSPFPNTVSVQTSLGQTGPTPVILQYLPHGLPGSVQYLQLIPTRPLIVPISPYITQIPNYQIHQQLHQQQQAQQKSSSVFPNLTARTSAGIAGDQMPAASKNVPQGTVIGMYATPVNSFNTPSPNSINSLNSINSVSSMNPTNSLTNFSNYINSPPPSSPPSESPNSTSSSSNSLGSVNGASINYFRPNSGMEIVNPPPDLSLNTNEFLPSFAASSSLNKIIIGRP